jgi:TolB-like protein
MERQSPTQASTTAAAVFLSYASQDAEAAARLCAALQGAGIEVWFDRSELRGGEAWDASIRRQIKECALFVPLISANTEARAVGYFRREWHLAVDRMLDYAEDQPFLLPVVIDDTAEATARVPDRFRERQWTCLKGGEATPEWVERTRRLLTGPAAPARRAALPALRRRRHWPTVLAALSGAALVAVIATTLWKQRTATVGPLPAPKAVTPAAPARNLKAIAVLPFDNLSARAEDSYLADGLQAEVLNTLARLRELSVISRTSTLEYKGKAYNVRDIGYRLGVGTILEGSIRRDGNKLRLSIQLVDTNNDRPLLAANYDRDLGHLLDLQSTVARHVADSLLATLSRNDRGELDQVGTNNGDAYDLYLKAMARLNQAGPDDAEKLREPKRLLEAAVKLDPGYAEAYAWLSLVNTSLFYKTVPRHPEDGVAARHAFERAFEIDPDLPEARLARGMYATDVALDPGQATVDLQAVVRSRPSSAWAHLVLGLTLRRLGRMDEALGHFVRAWDLDPLNQANSLQPLVTLLGLRRWPEAIEQSVLQLRRFPDDAWHSMFRAHIESVAHHDVEPMRVALREHGQEVDAKARAVIEFEVAIAEGRYLDAISLQNIGWSAEDADYRETYGGILYHAAGDERRARQSFLAAERHALASHGTDSKELAIAQSMLGLHTAALATIDRARANVPESRDALNGPEVSFVRSVILARAGRSEEAYAEVSRLLRVPFGAPLWKFGYMNCVALLVKDDPHYAELLYRAPRL